VSLLVAGAVLHDIGKLEELEYDVAPSYSAEGALVGHVIQGVALVRAAAARTANLSTDRRLAIEHMIASHHGSKAFGAPVEPMTPEAVILSMADALDATLHQVRRHIDQDEGPGAFTSYHSRLGRAFYKGGR
jgi:3'-5' exoribonuclease